MTDTTTRYRYGKPDDRGCTPVYVDGAAEPAGHVRNLGRGTLPWWSEGTGSGGAGSHHATKHEAAERLVRSVDIHAQLDRIFDRIFTDRRHYRTQAPAGWRFVDWTEIEREGYRQVRPVHRAPHIHGDEGERYPDAFADQPVTLTRVTTLHNGCVLVSGTEPGDRPPYVLLMDPAHVKLGALVREREPRYVAPAGECMGCEQDGALYQAGTRLGCASCTAADLGISVTDLPGTTAVADEGEMWWSVGDTVRRKGEIPDENTEPETGRVIETETFIVERTRRVAVDFGDRYPVLWQPAGLTPVE
ncbi:hypothetical protein [Streptomyces candidus]|uniref:Uncharacterized protein n=1 Tax=Streptomyces candidus TaxID=67283 RepID=A0A7X0LST3_9ACTN|nr:hypothetical protein [Streptomyces candidus]MBB6439542.1 hypothetical protein [Streptomyces candidus]GHH54502.1 hypothetical protein GCM10018773_57550 [Streptomyces candidus]